jgi:hypothetical protein
VPNDKLINDLYDGVVLPDLGNPLAGRVAWCSERDYWVDAQAELDEYAGKPVTFRFRLGTDSSVNSSWYIDDVRVQACRDPDVRLIFLPVVLR